MITVASFGGGTDSTAMLIGMRQRGEIPKLILFADTGAEKPATYAHIFDFNLWLTKNGMPEITIVSSTGKTLEQDCLDRHALPSIAYGFKTCSQRFKMQPQDKFMNNWIIAHLAWKDGEKITRCIGYEAGEERRVKEYEFVKYINRYPLIEWGWNREKCVEVIKAEGLTLPGKSACFYCPSSKAKEVRWLSKNHPDLFQRAVAMERNATNLTTVKGLGRDYSWGEMMTFEDKQLDLLDTDHSTAEIPCGCYDGE